MHRIRLRGPWEVSRLCDAPCGDEAVAKVRLPATWAAALGEVRSVRLSRGFGCPATEIEESIWLEIESAFASELFLNGRRIAAVPAGAHGFDVTGRLATRNRLDIDLRRSGDLAGDEPLPEVSLLIRSHD